MLLPIFLLIEQHDIITGHLLQEKTVLSDTTVVYVIKISLISCSDACTIGSSSNTRPTSDVHTQPYTLYIYFTHTTLRNSFYIVNYTIICNDPYVPCDIYLVYIRVFISLYTYACICAFFCSGRSSNEQRE